jgi:hypothetical protein
VRLLAAAATASAALLRLRLLPSLMLLPTVWDVPDWKLLLSTSSPAQELAAVPLE